MYRLLADMGSRANENWRDLILGLGPRGRPIATRPREPTIIFDVHGRVVASISSTTVRLVDVAPCVWQAVVAAEDRRFFHHHGVDLRGIGRAVFSLGKQGGGSSITQQLVKNALLSHEHSITRKAVEVLLALLLEGQIAKHQILEQYVNRVYWGHGAYGIAAAAATFFGKKPSDLNASEAALLASLLPAPEYYSPFRSPELANKMRCQVLRIMQELGYLTEAECARWIQEGLPASLTFRQHMRDGSGPEAPTHIIQVPKLKWGVPYRAPFFVSEVLRQLEEVLGRDALDAGGLEVHTTMDLSMQEMLEAAVLSPLAPEARGRPSSQDFQVAALLMDPRTGGVRAMVGSRDYSKSSYNRALNSLRSPGSCFKAISYTAAFEKGLVSPSSSVVDEEVCFRRRRRDDEDRRRSGGILSLPLKWIFGSDSSDEWQVISRSAMEKELLDRDEKLKWLYSSGFAMGHSEADMADQMGSLGGWEPPQNDLPEDEEDFLLGESEGGGTAAIAAKETAAAAGNSSSSSDAVRKDMGAQATTSSAAGLALNGPQKQKQQGSAAIAKHPPRPREYMPLNYTRGYKGKITVLDAFANSLNVPAVKLCNAVGPQNVVATARALGIRSPLKSSLALPLGACEILPVELCTAFNTLAAGGIYAHPHVISVINDENKHTLYRYKIQRRKAVSKPAARSIDMCLRAAVTRGTCQQATGAWGRASGLAAKSGTSDNYRDAWFAGYLSESISAAVWCGHDDNQPLSGTGSMLAGPLFTRIMRRAAVQLNQNKHQQRARVAAAAPAGRGSSGSGSGSGSGGAGPAAGPELDS